MANDAQDYFVCLSCENSGKHNQEVDHAPSLKVDDGAGIAGRAGDYWLCTLGYKTRFHDERIELMIGFQTLSGYAAIRVGI